MVKILAVDDNPANLRIIERAFRRKNYEILKATDGPSAVEIAKTQSPTIILLDIVMPEMDGYAVCEMLNSDPKTENIPVIFVTALTEELDKQKGIGLGAVDFITKPFNSRALAERIEIQLMKNNINKVAE